MGREDIDRAGWVIDPREGDFSLEPGSPAAGAASDFTNIGAWQRDNRSNRVFLTSKARLPDFGGLRGADRYCLEEADAAGLRGTWIAWLSDRDRIARDRISGGDFRLVDGTVVAGDVAELLSGTLRVPINQTAYDEVIDGALVWTARQADGSFETQGGTCDAWTWASRAANSQTGLSSATDTLWTDQFLSPCDLPGHLYCFEVDPGLSKTVFVTSRIYGANLGGLAGADAICSDLAATHEIPGIFKAWLSAYETSAADRLQHATIRYRRLDGVLVAEDWNALTSGDLAAPIDVSETGGHIALEAWTGTATDGSQTGGTCEDWTHGGDDSGRGTIGRTLRTDSAWTEFGTAPCSREKGLYCIED